jgi:membrane associated rhomboid family serine protease
MIPLRDHNRSARFPVVTLGLILLNALAFAWELSLGRELGRVLHHLGVVPVRYTDAATASYYSFLQLGFPFLSSMFLHGGWLHLIGNLWTLWIFGDNVEDRLGRGRYLALYLTGGAAAAALHVFTNAGSPLPVIGASGAIAAVMGAYFRFYPGARIDAVVPPFVFGPVIMLPAVVFLGLWFLLQFFQGAAALGAATGRAGGIAWWAHIGGFAFGVLVCLAAGRTRERAQSWED